MITIHKWETLLGRGQCPGDYYPQTGDSGETPARDMAKPGRRVALIGDFVVPIRWVAVGYRAGLLSLLSAGYIPGSGRLSAGYIPGSGRPSAGYIPGSGRLGLRLRSPSYGGLGIVS